MTSPATWQQIDSTGYVWTFLDEASDPARVTVGAIVLTGDDDDPVRARVVSLTDRPTGVKVHLELLRDDVIEGADERR